MVRTRQTKGSAVGHPEPQENTTTPKITPDDPTILSVSTSPSRTGGTGTTPPANHVPKPAEDQPEDDNKFMPTTAQVVETLAAMKSRHG